MSDYQIVAVSPSGIVECNRTPEEAAVALNELSPEDMALCEQDMVVYGNAFVKDGKRLDPKHVLALAEASDTVDA